MWACRRSDYAGLVCGWPSAWWSSWGLGTQHVGVGKLWNDSGVSSQTEIHSPAHTYRHTQLCVDFEYFLSFSSWVSLWQTCRLVYKFHHIWAQLKAITCCILVQLAPCPLMLNHNSTATVCWTDVLIMHNSVLNTTVVTIIKFINEIEMSLCHTVQTWFYEGK